MHLQLYMLKEETENIHFDLHGSDPLEGNLILWVFTLLNSSSAPPLKKKKN